MTVARSRLRSTFLCNINESNSSELDMAEPFQSNSERVCIDVPLQWLVGARHLYTETLIKSSWAMIDGSKESQHNVTSSQQ